MPELLTLTSWSRRFLAVTGRVNPPPWRRSLRRLSPDLTLLHFRNTTEAGATSGSRDKGLHGKLKAGVCYSMLDTINSRHQRVVVGVRLQQVAGRDRKVDIKPFAIQGLPMSVQPTQLVTETLNERQARVPPLNELKDKLEGDGRRAV